MFGIEFHSRDDWKGLEQKALKGNYRSLGHAAASIRRDVLSTIERSPEYAAVGTPIHTRKGLMKKAIRFEVNKEYQDAVIGPRYSVVETSGEPHEKGVPYMGRNYPKRAFMMPGLLRALPRLTAYWSGSIG